MPEMTPDALNSIQISGKILNDPKLRRPNNRTLAVLSFTAETLDTVGKSGRIEPVRWRAKLFGTLAEKAVRELGREVHVIVVGRVSGYEGVADPKANRRKKTRRNDVDLVIDVHKYAVVPAPVLVSSMELEEGGEFIEDE